MGANDLTVFGYMCRRYEFELVFVMEQFTNFFTNWTTTVVKETERNYWDNMWLF